MEIYIKILTITTFGLSACISFAGPNGPTDNSKTMNLCFGQIESCAIGDVNISAAGDKASFDTTGLEVTNLGRITKKISTEIRLSEGKKIYAFTPTEGNPATQNKQIKILFYTFNLENALSKELPETIYSDAQEAKEAYPWAKTMVKIYRQLPSETQWTELSMTLNDALIADLRPMSIELYPDARAIIYPLAHKDAHGNLIKPKPMIADLSKAF